MRQDFTQKRIPTLLGFLILIFGLILMTFVSRKSTNFFSKASPTVFPEKIKITNISDTSFTVSYITKESTTGFISYGTSNLDNNLLDDRDKTNGNFVKRKLHYFTAENLTPSTTYYFSITSGKDKFLDNGIPFEATTARKVNKDDLSRESITGTVQLPDSSIPNEAIAYLSSSNIQDLSMLINKDGIYTFFLDNIFTKNFNSYYSFAEEDMLEIEIISDKEASKIILLKRQIKSIPLITLSQNYDFTLTKPDREIVSVSSGSARSFNFPLSSFSLDTSKGTSLQSPAKNETFIDPRPLFKGKANPNETIEIIINSEEEIRSKIKADSKGNWTFRPATNLSPGIHTITILAKDEFGFTQKITRSFTVFASGTTVSESATPSATPVVTQQPTQVPTQIPTLAITQVPTQTPSEIPTQIPTTFPTLIPTDITITSIPTVIPTKPPVAPKEPGASTIVIAGVIGAASTFIGIMFFLISRGNISL